jgi:prepilin-type N-terminal cleavage/methylation domain-containing protein/prepilin-type processing-associated H-X9-DG protein
MSSRRGFTLVELLVVIGIIALLISMLLPSLNRARESAKSVACLSQLRQIGSASALYVNEYRGYLVPSHVLPGTPDGDRVHQFLKKYVPNTAGRTVWTCPNAIPGVNDEFPLTYGANQSVHVFANSFLPKNPPLAKITRIRTPAECIAFADASQTSGVFTTGGWLDNTGYPGAPFLEAPGNYTDPNSAPVTASMMNTSLNALPGWQDRDITGANYHGRWRHAGNTRINVVFVDGHAASFPKNELKYRNLARNPN